MRERLVHGRTSALTITVPMCVTRMATKYTSYIEAK
jgi:hypothetical protein